MSSLKESSKRLTVLVSRDLVYVLVRGGDQNKTEEMTPVFDTTAHLCPAEVVGCRQQPLHFMAEPRTSVTHLHAALSSSPLETILCHRSPIAGRGLQDKV